MEKNPQKLITGRYHVVPRSLILVFDDDKVLLQKGAKDKKIWAGLYNGFGGHVERGEDILASAKREFFEETGLSCHDLHLLGTVMIDVNEQEGILMFVFSGDRIEGEIKPSEEGMPEWIEISRISSLPLVEDIPLLIKKIRHEHHGKTFHGHYSYDENGKLKAEFSQ
jgi:8-oxo-dGTP diphosphatase